MSQSTNDNQDEENGPTMNLTWAGTLTDHAEKAKRYLHLSAFPCPECGGPVIAGWLATREQAISKDTEVTQVGVICLSCGARAQATANQQLESHFRPVEWEWPIKKKADPAGLHEATSPEAPTAQTA